MSDENSILEKAQHYIVIEIAVDPKTNQKLCNALRLKREKFTVDYCSFIDNDFLSNTEALLVQWASSANTGDIVFANYLLIDNNALGDKQKLENITLDLGLEFEMISKFPIETEDDTTYSQLFSNEENLKIEAEPFAKPLINFLLDKENLLKVNAFYKKFNFSLFKPSSFLKIDVAAIHALSLYEKPERAGDSGSANTVYTYMSQYVSTQMGLRVLKEWLLQPLRNVADINFRLETTKMYVANPELRKSLKGFLRRIPNLDKLIVKFWRFRNAQRGSFGLTDCYKLYQVLLMLNDLITNIKPICVSNEDKSLYDMLCNIIADFENLEAMIEKYIDLERADKTGECFVNPGCSSELTSIHEKILSCNKSIEIMRQEISEEMGAEVSSLDNMKVGIVFEANKDKAMSFFRVCKERYTVVTTRKSTLTFTLKELTDINLEVQSLKQLYLDTQKQFSENFLQVASSYLPALEATNYMLLEHDILSGFAEMFLNPKDSNSFCFPTVLDPNDGSERMIKLRDSWHICIRNCVPNSLSLSESECKVATITGPNMGGKSTFIRQAALALLLAHVGCPVPATSCTVSLLSGIYTRVGASDAQLKGISTFMNEMMETSNLLASADENSLVVIDELGRGTSTYEGLGLAQAILEHIIYEKRCFGLFATHYFELTKLSTHVPSLKNLSMKTIEREGNLIFTYQIVEGAVDKSFGIHLIEHMNFPQEIIDEAKRIASRLENFKR